MKTFLLLFFLVPLSFTAHASEKGDILEKIKSSGKITCGYAMWSPILYKNMDTNNLAGISYDIMEEIGKRLDLKIEWAEETGWGTIIEGLNARRYDMICTGLAASSARAKFIDFTTSYFYAPLHVAVRTDDARFDKDYDSLNDPTYKIAVLEGEMSAITAAQRFPKATVSAISQITDYSLLLKEVESGKADATLIEPSTFADYDKNNPGKLKIISKKNPVNMLPVTFGLPQNADGMRQMIDIALRELILDGTVDRIIKKYEPREGIYLPVTRGYQD